jgi:hypothetical protein
MIPKGKDLSPEEVTATTEHEPTKAAPPPSKGSR